MPTADLLTRVLELLDDLDEAAGPHALTAASLAQQLREAPTALDDQPKHCTERKCEWVDDQYLPCVEMSTNIQLGRIAVEGQPPYWGDTVFTIRFCPFCGGDVPIACALLEYWK